MPAIENWAKTIRYDAARLLRPTSLEELRSQIGQELARGGKLRALGSRYSFSACLRETGSVFDLGALRRIEVYPRYGGGPSPLTDAAYDEPLTTGHAFVQGGVIIDEFCRAIAARGLAPFTLGGSSGQTLVGATSTSTHGADFDQFPFPEYVVGLHVTNGGARDLWLERPAKGGPRTTKAGVAAMLGIAESAFDVVVSEAAFDAAVVSLGCGGIVAGALVRVRPDGILNERLYEGVPWERVKRALLDGSAFDKPPGEGTDAPEGKFRYLEIIVNPYSNPTSCFVAARNELPAAAEPLTAPTVARPSPNMIQFAIEVGSNLKNSSSALGRLIRGTRLSGRDAQGKWAYYPYSALINVGVPAYLPVYSYEFCWPEKLSSNGRDRDYVVQIERAIALVKAGMQVGLPFIGTLSLRFSRGTSAYLGMQYSSSPGAERFAHLEVAALQDFANKSNQLPLRNRKFLDTLFAHPISQTARMHWGQSARKGGYHTALRYPRSDAFRAELRALLGDRAGRFTNEFCEVARANP